MGREDDYKKNEMSFDNAATVTLAGARMGMWFIILGDGEPKFVTDATTRELVGCDPSCTPEEAYAFWYSRVDESYLDDVSEVVDGMLSGKPGEVIYPYYHPEKGTITIRCGGILDTSYTGAGQRLRGYHQDITEFNARLLEEVELSRAFASIYYVVLDVDMRTEKYRMVRYNEKIDKAYGNAEHSYRKLVADMTGGVKENKDEFTAFFELETLEERLKKSEEINLRCQETLMNYSRIRIVPVLYDQDGRLRRFICTFRNIDAEIREEKRYRDRERRIGDKLKASEAQYRIIQAIVRELQVERAQYRDALALGCDYYFSFDVTEGFLREEVEDKNGNRHFENMGLVLPVSYDVESSAYRKAYGVEILDERTKLIFSTAGLLKLYAEGTTAEEFVYYEKVNDRFLSVQVLLSKDERTGHVLTTMFCSNVTESVKAKKEQDKQLREALSKAETANVAKTSFLNNMSHDIRTPMNAIIGFTTLAEKHIDEKEKALDYIHKIQTSGNHLLSLINDVLDMSRIESGKIKIEPVETYLPDIINDLKDITFSDASVRELHVEFVADKIVNTCVLCDKLRLNQVLLNCLSNAIKFTPAGGRITVSMEEKESRKKGCSKYLFRVKDTGIGMSDDFLEHIFEPFERERTSTVSGIQGTGLGMSICKNLVEMMGGTISVESKKGKGTEITIELQLKRCTKEGSLLAERKEARDIGGLKILLVEDNELNTEIAKELLTELGAKVDTAGDGLVALSILEKSKKGAYDLILMDVQMPELNGYETTKRIRSMTDKWYSDIAIIAMTANAFEDDKKLALEAGMDAHVSKPIDVMKIVDTINLVVG